MIYACGCMCGSTESLIRNFLKRQGYQDWLSISIEIGKEKSMKLIDRFPPRVELMMLKNYLQDKGKWAVIIGIDDEACRWSDLSRGGEKSAIEAEFLVQRFA